jgi:transcriptional regulator with XRE-family HTH domain
MSEILKEFSERLGSLIKKRGTNVNRLSKKVGVVPQTIWNYIDNGHSPDSFILYRLSQALGVTMEHLLTGEAIEQKQPILLSKEHTAARENLDHIFRSRNRKTIEAIFSNLEQFAKLVDFETGPGEEEEKLTG